MHDQKNVNDGRNWTRLNKLFREKFSETEVAMYHEFLYDFFNTQGYDQTGYLIVALARLKEFDEELLNLDNCKRIAKNPRNSLNAIIYLYSRTRTFADIPDEKKLIHEWSNHDNLPSKAKLFDYAMRHIEAKRDFAVKFFDLCSFLNSHSFTKEDVEPLLDLSPNHLGTMHEILAMRFSEISDYKNYEEYCAHKKTIFKEILEQCLYKDQKLTFLLACRDQKPGNSSVRFFSHNSAYDKNLATLITDFLRPDVPIADAKQSDAKQTVSENSDSEHSCAM